MPRSFRSTFCALVLALPITAQNRVTPDPIRFRLTTDTPRAAGPVDVELSDVTLPDEPLAAAVLVDGTPVRIDTIGDPARLRLRWFHPRALDEPEDLELRFVELEQADAPFVLAAEDEGPTLRLHGRAVWRAMARFDPDAFESTYKPFHHLFDVTGEVVLTKGPGGTFPHHRGLFVGWNRTSTGGITHDFWHCTKGRHQVRVGGAVSLSPVVGDTVDQIEWQDEAGGVIVLERRTLSVWDAGIDANLIDVAIELRAAGRSVVRLAGDPQHAGCQIRLAQEVHEHQDGTRYTRPESAQDRGNDVWTDCAWARIHTKIAGREAVVWHSSHPANPRPWVYSTRAYGRFGSFQSIELEPDVPVVLRYRIAIRAGDATDDPVADYAVFGSTLRAVKSGPR